MSNVIALNPNDYLTVDDNEVHTTSLKVADAFNRRHDDILKKVRNLKCSEEFNARNFAGVEYLDNKGEKRPSYQMTKDGFIFLVMGFTGQKAAQIKEAYIKAFNLMYEKITSQKPDPLKLTYATVEQRAPLVKAVHKILTKWFKVVLSSIKRLRNLQAVDSHPDSMSFFVSNDFQLVNIFYKFRFELGVPENNQYLGQSLAVSNLLALPSGVLNRRNQGDI